MAALINSFARAGAQRPTLRAAARWEVAVLEADQRQQWARADRARLHWALCLHRLGCCDDAVEALRQAWAGEDIGRRDGQVVAAILCIRLLRWCGRQDEAGALWWEMEKGTTSVMRRRALNELQSLTFSEPNEPSARKHRMLCGYRRPEISATCRDSA